jgi:hypothetical protein
MTATNAVASPTNRCGFQPRTVPRSALPSSYLYQSVFFLKPFFRKIFSNMPLTERFQEMNSCLGAINIGAKITQLGAVNVSAKPPCHLADDAELALTWQHLSAVTIDAKLGAIVIGAKPGATDLLPCISFFYPKYFLGCSK